MPLFKPKPSRKKRLQGAFSEPLHTTARERAAEIKEAAKDAAIRKLAREKKKEAERQAAVDNAEAIKARALARREAAEKARAAKAKKKPAAPPAERTACTCRKPQLDSAGKCRRCKKRPASRRRGLFGLCLVRHRTVVRTARS